MEPNIGSLIGWGLTVLAIVGGVVLRDRQVLTMINDGDDKIDERLNRVKDEYVRRDDLDQHIRRIEKSVEEMRTEMHEQRRTNERLDNTLTGLSGMMQTMMQMLSRMAEARMHPQAKE